MPRCLVCSSDDTSVAVIATPNIRNIKKLYYRVFLLIIAYFCANKNNRDTLDVISNNADTVDMILYPRLQLSSVVTTTNDCGFEVH